MLKTIFVALLAVLAIPAAQASAAPKAKFRFSSSTYTVSEGAGSAQITVRKTRGSSGAVSYTARAGTASAADFQAVSGTLTFAAGEHTKTFGVPITSDAIQEGNETVLLNINPARGSSAGNPRATLTIVDDDGPARVSFETAATGASESAGSHTLNVLRAGDTAASVSVNFAVTGGSAPASDYTVNTSSPIQFATGETAKTISVGLADNGVADGDRTVTFGLSGITSSNNSAALQAPTSSTLSILDDDSPSSVAFDAGATWTAAENQDTFLVTLRRSGSVDKPATVDLRTSDGSAFAGSDYDAADPNPDVVYFDAGESIVTYALGIVDDSLHENSEAFNVALLNADGTTFAGGAQVIGEVVTIEDDDPMPITIGDVSSTPTGPDGSTDAAGTSDAAAGSSPAPSQLVAGAQTSGCRLTVKALRKQRLLRRKAILLRLKSAGACTVSIKATAKRIKPRSKTTTVKLTPGKTVIVRVRFGKTALSSLLEVLRRKTPVTTRVNVSAIDETGRKSSRSLRIKIRR